jgi:tetratricopeptide (TPR) repeat protein
VAIREVRQALHANPDDPQAYIRLARLYMTLFLTRGEFPRTVGNGFIQPALIRHAQITTALHRVLELNPEPKDEEEAHRMLAEWYMLCRQNRLPCYIDPVLNVQFNVQFYDVELKHRQEELRLFKEWLESLKPGEGEDPETKKKTNETVLKQRDQQLQTMQNEVKGRLNKYEIEAAGTKNVVQRAHVALKWGLAEEAMAQLRKATPEEKLGKGSQQGPLGYLMEVKLSLSMGEVDEVRSALRNPAALSNLGTLPEFGILAYDWFRLVAAAAVGDYDEADDVLGSIQDGILSDPGRLEPLRHLSYRLAVTNFRKTPRTGELLGLLTGDLLLDAVPPPVAFPPLKQWPVEQLTLTGVAMSYFQRDTDYPALRGWLDLEAGDTVAARKHLGEALIRPPRNRSPAFHLAVGQTGMAEPVRVGERPYLLLRSTPLAEMGMQMLDSVPPERR